MAKELSSFEELDKIIKKEFEEVIDLSQVDNSVKNFYSFGIYALNYLATKNIFGAVASGRVTSVSGLSSTGKSLLSAAVVADPKIDMCIIVETEGGGATRELAIFAGANPAKIRMLKANTYTSYRINKKTGKVEEVADNDVPKKKETDEYIYKEGAIRQMRHLIQTIEMKGIESNILVVLDSLGNLQSVKEYAGDGNADMGRKQQNINAFFRTFDLAFERTNIAFLYTNKLYTNVGNAYDPWKESGGVAVDYNPSLSIRLQEVTNAESQDMNTADVDKEKERRKTALGNSLKTIRATITKSRFGTEGRRLNILIDNITGPVLFSGLFELCKDFGLIAKAGSMYSMPDLFDKSFYKKDFIGMLRADEMENLKKIQVALLKAEERLVAERKGLQVNDMEEVDEVEPTEEVDGKEDYSEMLSLAAEQKN